MTRLVLLAAALALLLLHPYHPRFPSPSEVSRLCLLEAIVADGTLSIDRPLERYPGLEDKVVFGGRSYSNKPPGLVLLALPAYALAAKLAGPLDEGRALDIARLFAVSLPLFAFLLALAGFLARRRLGDTTAAALLAATAFGTGLLPYGVLFMAHATAAAALGLAALALLREEARPSDPLVVGLLVGLAVSVEYPAAVPGAVLLVWTAARAARPATLLRVALGLAPALVVVLGYNALVFGNPFDLGYSHHVDPGFAAIHTRPLSGFGWPTPAALLGLSLLPAKGLLAWSPFLILAAAGASRHKPLAVAAAALVVFIAGYPNWHGGWAVGPRYLLAIVPFLVLLASAALQSEGLARRLLPGLALASIALHALATLTWPFVPELLDNPVRSLLLPLLASALSPRALLALLPIGLAAFVVLRLRLVTTVALAAGVVALHLAIPERGPARFCRGEVRYLMGDDARAAAEFRELLARERPSPAMRAHVAARLRQIYGAAGSGAEPPAGRSAGSN